MNITPTSAPATHNGPSTTLPDEYLATLQQAENNAKQLRQLLAELIDLTPLLLTVARSYSPGHE